MAEVRLTGCSPDSVGTYLGAIGVLRLVGEQADPEALGWWEEDCFVLASRLSEEDLSAFFTERYAPTPIIAPWNKDSGFYRRVGPLDPLVRSADPRLAAYQGVIAGARTVLDEFGWHDAPGKDEEKAHFVTALRSRLPEPFVRWMDAVGALASEDPSWAPLFVAGGADGRTEFTSIFARCITEVFGVDGRARRGTRPTASSDMLRAALFGDQIAGASIEATGGLLHPSSVDAPNAAPGFMGTKRLNPWSYVLSVEGALLLAGAVSRRFGASVPPRAVFPFTVESAGGGHAGAGNEASRGELWLPIWRRPVGSAELSHLFREARAVWRGRPVGTATDMARAVVSLGVDRGLSAFVRFGIQARHGRGHLAVALGRLPVRVRPDVELLGELDGFLASLRRMTRTGSQPTGGEAPRDAVRQGRRRQPGKRQPTGLEALRHAVRRLETAMLEYAAFGGRARLLEVLLAASHAELTLARRPSLRMPGFLSPLGGLSLRWVRSCDDGTTEFELAAALASLRSSGEAEESRPLRTHLEPVTRVGRTWRWAEGLPHDVVWTGRDVVRDLGAVLVRRLIGADREGTDPGLEGHVHASPWSVAALLEGEIEAARLGHLIESLALIEWDDARKEPVLVRERQGLRSSFPDAYAVIKLALLGRPIRSGGDEVKVRPDLTTLGLLQAGQVWEATLRAARRLRASGLDLKGFSRLRQPSPVAPNPALGRRLLAALLLPVQEQALVNLVLEEKDRGEEDTR